MVNNHRIVDSEDKNGKIIFPFFKKCQKFIKEFRDLIHYQDALTETFFLIIYLIEQVGLVYATTIFRNNVILLSSSVAIFVIFLLTTLGINRVVLESKNRYIKNDYNNFIIKYHELESLFNSSIVEYESQQDLLRTYSKENQRLSKENEELFKVLK